MSLVNDTIFLNKYNAREIFNGIGYTTGDGEIFTRLGPSAGARTTVARAAESPAMRSAVLHGTRPAG